MKNNNRIVVLGGGESGYGSAVLAKVKGFEVFLSDSGPLSERYTAVLDEYGIDYEQSGHTEALIYSAGEVVKSPGIPESAPIIRGLRECNIPVISEIEFAGRFTRGRTICISGSNGKTTTTTLVFEILRKAGYNVGLAGNIGKSFAYTVATQDMDWYVMELSSFQLDGMFDFRADTAVLLNITPDHLDRYDYDFNKYADSKMRLTQNQRPGDNFIYWADDKIIPDKVEAMKPSARLLPFSIHEKHEQGAWLGNDGFITAAVGQRVLRIDTGRLHIKGLHNICNVMAASAAAMTAGVPDEDILRAVYAFEGVEHRMEFIAEIQGIEYINDSKATNVDSAWYALDSMSRPTVWIAGGTDKGNDYTPLKDLAREKVKALVCMGVDNSKLMKNFEGIIPEIYDTHSLADAMEACSKAASAGDTVILSPACASFDLFRNYEDRGRQFKERVKLLKKSS